MAAGIRYGNRSIISGSISVGVEAGNQVSRTFKVRLTCLRPMPVTRLTPFVAARITISGGVASLTPGYLRAPLRGAGYGRAGWPGKPIAPHAETRACATFPGVSLRSSPSSRFRASFPGVSLRSPPAIRRRPSGALGTGERGGRANPSRHTSKRVHALRFRGFAALTSSSRFRASFPGVSLRSPPATRRHPCRGAGYGRMRWPGNTIAPHVETPACATFPGVLLRSPPAATFGHPCRGAGYGRVGVANPARIISRVGSRRHCRRLPTHNPRHPAQGRGDQRPSLPAHKPERSSRRRLLCGYRHRTGRKTRCDNTRGAATSAWVAPSVGSIGRCSVTGAVFTTKSWLT